MKKELITIAGAIGSGKSSTAKGVATVLGYEHFSSGDLFRKIATERGLSIEAINLSLEERNDVDRGVDDLLKEIGKKTKYVIDSRLAFHWMPDSFKVFLHLDPETAANRIFSHIKESGRVSQMGASVAEIRENSDLRAASEKRRYLSLYGVDITDMDAFDIVVNTKDNDLATVTAIVLGAYRAWLEN